MPEHPQLKPGALLAADGQGLTEQAIRHRLAAALEPIRGRLRRVLLLPPDYTRLHANAGLITRALYQLLHPACRVDILPALGTHVPVTQAQWQEMFGDIPYSLMLVHSWREDLVELGEVPGDFVRQVSQGLVADPIPVEVNRRLLDPAYDLILSIGQVVPHEVVGMANHSKNVLVGCGGARIINASHMLGAVYGMERMMGQDRTPVRAVLDYAAEHFLQDLPLQYILTVCDAPGGRVRTHGLFIGRERRWFEQAVALAQRVNITRVERPLPKVVVYLDQREFQSTWLGNKAVYRSRMAIADGGELIVLAPGVDRFGEDPAVDALIRRHGYRGRAQVLDAVARSADLRANLSAAAHLIHGSSEGRFRITYCTRRLSREEVEGVGYGWLPYEEAVLRYPPGRLAEGFNRLPDGEEVYYIANPALGLWMAQGGQG